MQSESDRHLPPRESTEAGCDIIETEKGSWLGRTILRTKNPLVDLTSLYLKLSENVDDNLLNILRLTPSLERLKVRGAGWWQADAHEGKNDEVPLRLLRLREVLLCFFESARAMESISKAAPRLVTGRFSTEDCYDEGMKHPASFWRCRTLRHVACVAENDGIEDVDKEDLELRFLAAEVWRRADMEGFFPNAESLVLDIEVSERHTSECHY